VVPFVFVVYLVTRSPTVGLIDSGEIAAGVHLLNILHPTGYPIYTVLGRLVSLVPIGTVVSRVGMLSALLAAVGVGLFLLLCLRLGLSAPVSGISALLLGFSFPVWSVAVDVEVYSLTLVLVCLLWLGVESAERGGPVLILAYLAGLTLSNHMTAASTVLGVVLAVVMTFRRELVRRIPALALLFLLGVTPYLILVVRAHAGPLFPWGNPVNLQRLYWHVTGRQYQVWMFTESFADVIRNAGRGALLLAGSFAYVLVPVVVWGAVRLFRTRPALAWGLLVSSVACFAYAVNYSIPDIESYYIPCLVALAVFGAVGLAELAKKLGRWQHVAWLAVVALLVVNYRAAGKQGDFVAYDHAVNTLASAGPNATIITDWWDVYSPALYLQHVEGARPDLCMIDKELLRRSWYFKYLARAYPWLVQNSKPEIDAYMEYLNQFEHNRLQDASEIQRRYIAMLESFVLRNPERPAYTTFDADANQDARQMLDQGSGVRGPGPGPESGPRSPIPNPRPLLMVPVPVGLLFQLRSDSLLPEFDYTRMVVRTPRHTMDMRTLATLERYRYFLMRRLQWLAAQKRTAEMQALVDWYRASQVSAVAPLPAPARE
jgi:hypothetical protein